MRRGMGRCFRIGERHKQSHSHIRNTAQCTHTLSAQRTAQSVHSEFHIWVPPRHAHTHTHTRNVPICYARAHHDRKFYPAGIKTAHTHTAHELTNLKSSGPASHREKEQHILTNTHRRTHTHTQAIMYSVCW